MACALWKGPRSPRVSAVGEDGKGLKAGVRCRPLTPGFGPSQGRPRPQESRGPVSDGPGTMTPFPGVYIQPFTQVRPPPPLSASYHWPPAPSTVLRLPFSPRGPPPPTPSAPASKGCPVVARGLGRFPPLPLGPLRPWAAVPTRLCGSRSGLECPSLTPTPPRTRPQGDLRRPTPRVPGLEPGVRAA